MKKTATAALVVSIVAIASLSADVIVKPKGSGAAELAGLLVQSTGGATRVVELTGSTSADAAAVQREGQSGGVIYAIGPDACAAAKGIDKAKVVALNVPNPDRATTVATYVSLYPNLQKVVALLVRKMGAARIGIVFTPTQNHEVAVRFGSALSSAGAHPRPLPVTAANAGQVVRSAAAQLDALLLLVDPIVFDARALRDITAASAASKLTTVGFLPDLASLGVTVALAPPPRSVAAAATRAAAAGGGRKTVEADEIDIVVSTKSAQEVGLDPTILGPHSTR